LLAAWLWLQRRESAIGRRRAVAVSLAELDARTLKDIGLEAWRSPLGAEVALRRHDSRRWRAAYLGLW
jgi:hypothetical protein